LAEGKSGKMITMRCKSCGSNSLHIKNGRLFHCGNCGRDLELHEVDIVDVEGVAIRIAEVSIGEIALKSEKVFS
jgi:uncharacterized Zn finger protein (UPF0148 family)